MALPGDQLPNLRALADYMDASFKKMHGNKAVVCAGSQLSEYFDKIESAEKTALKLRPISLAIGGLGDSGDTCTNTRPPKKSWKT